MPRNLCQRDITTIRWGIGGVLQEYGHCRQRRWSVCGDFLCGRWHFSWWILQYNSCLINLIANTYSPKASMGFLYCTNKLMIPWSSEETSMLVHINNCIMPCISVPSFHSRVTIVAFACIVKGFRSYSF